ncbi:Sm ribonucleo [Candidatus Acidianus copahuensis]|uniref:Sm ribonucleo n=1 Tax=Candidatus Acidianus copahuensis TaxID=1160895 RepID=A0A031LLG6_9CREN|nr:Lsm family RNA-binding protein [Candidatus Acidianus copahuensis]EZQ03037.1 Sm ribonucleo [Candidatus Acidianus copahuensis]
MSLQHRVSVDLNSLVDKTIIVKLVNNRTYTGELSSFEISPLIIALNNAKDSENNLFYKVIINGDIISEILVKSPPLFDVREFASLLEKSLNLRTGDIKLYEEAGFITILDNIKVSENGVEGRGPLAQRINDIFDDYIAKKKKRS